MSKYNSGPAPQGWETIMTWSIKQSIKLNSTNWNGNRIVYAFHSPEMIKFCKIGKWHRSHGKLVHYQDQITRPPFWDMWHMRRQSTSNDSLTSISHQCVVLSPRAYFSRIFRVVQRPAQKVGNRQVRKKLSECCTKSGHNFHVNVGRQISNYHFTGYIAFRNVSNV